jgi:hypothetical protein
VLSDWRRRSLDDLLAANGLAGAAEEPFPNDGWSGARLTRLRSGGRSFVLKRTSWATDWIARATRDHALREGHVAAGALRMPDGIVLPHLGAGADGTAVAMLMPDLGGALLDWEARIGVDDVDRIFSAIARLHAAPAPDAFPWCPVAERVELLTPAAARRYAEGGLRVGDRFLAGWAAFGRLAPLGAVELVRSLAADSRPLVRALGALPPAFLHGDLKLANAGFVDGGVALIDWQMICRSPVAVELGWFLVSNVAALPEDPDAVLERYRRAAGVAGAPLGEWDAQVDLAVVVGLLLRGWRKGLDMDAGAVTGWGASAARDLAWWADRAVEAARRRL